MTPTRWRQVQALFQQVTELPAGQRETFLAAACSADAPLHDELRSLLDFDRPGTLTVVGGGSEGTATPSTDTLAAFGQRIGAYRLLREIGRGGMSTVFLAVRDDEHFEKRVALKVIRLGFGHEELVQRFRQERQILASLDHPHIARLLDGGNTEDGLPYFVMEYIEGMPIDRYCEAQALSVAERLRLFRTVCHAVHYAHQNLVVHRDLKPSNILVTAEGQPKLLDFGIAKLLNPQLTRAEVVSTTPSLQLMTAGYASPEQIRGEPITTASDVYSLGVLLYELLARALPFALEGLTPVEAARLVTDTPPVPPSQGRGRRPRRKASGPGAARSPSRQPLRMNRDLDAIVLMALRKEPSRRYGSAEQLAEDLARFLEVRPVRARPETLAYRAGKWIRRNRLAAALAVAGVLFAGGMTAQAIVASRARGLAEADQRRAEESERSMREVSEILLELIQFSDSDRAEGSFTAASSLGHGVERIERERAGQPLTQAVVFDLIGRAYGQIGRYGEEGRLLTRAYEIRKSLLPGGDPAIASSLHSLARHRYNEGEFGQAERLERESLALRTRSFGDHSLEVAESLRSLGEFLVAIGKIDEAEALTTRSLRLHRALLPRGHRKIAETLSSLGYLHYSKGDLEAAKRATDEAIALLTEFLSPEHPEVAETLITRGLVLAGGGDHQGAEELLARALRIRRQAYGERNLWVAETLNDLGFILNERGEPGRAEPYLREAVEIYRELNGGRIPMLGTSLANLAWSLHQQDRQEEARDTYEAAKEAYLRTIGSDQWSYTIALTGQAQVYRKLQQPDQEAALRSQTLRIRRQILPAGDPGIAESAFALGRLLKELDRPRESEPLLREAAEIFRAAGDEPWAAVCAIELAEALIAMNRRSEALPLVLAAAETLRGLEGPWARRARQAAELAAELSDPTAA